MNKLEVLGLVETTSETQKKNGTLCFHDPIMDCDYLSYASGYVRRKFKTTNQRSGKKFFTIYQLNKKRIVQQESNWMPGKFVECTERILIKDPSERLERLAYCVATYRNNNR